MRFPLSHLPTPHVPTLAVDAATTNGCTPLYIAANNGLADAAALLLELGASPDAETTSGCTPLHAGGRALPGGRSAAPDRAPAACLPACS